MPHDVRVRSVLEHLTFFCGQGTDAGGQCPGDGLEPPRHQRQANTRDLYSGEFGLLVLEDGGADARFVGSLLDHVPHLVEEEVEVGVATIAELLGPFVLLVVGEVAEDGDVVLEILGGGPQQ